MRLLVERRPLRRREKPRSRRRVTLPVDAKRRSLFEKPLLVDSERRSLDEMRLPLDAMALLVDRMRGPSVSKRRPSSSVPLP
jgi:hypothetical protein